MHHRGLSGVLYVEATARKKPYTKADLDLFSALAFKAGSALEAAILYRDLRDLFFGTVETLVDTIQEKDRYTSGHSRRVAYYASILGEALGLSGRERRNLRLAAVLHDIGKVGWPDRLLHNEDDLTPEELEQVQAHPRRGADLLERLPFMDQVIPGIRYHHEAFDGSGYPSGLEGNEIPLFARIIAVADTFDAVTTERPYQSRVEFDEGLEILNRQAKTRLDPDLVEVFVKAYPKMRANRRPSRTRTVEKGSRSRRGRAGSG
jgi:HD-GYP domain-containing protein (c-di-GMP phosphodiesterase class II)